MDIVAALMTIKPMSLIICTFLPLVMCYSRQHFVAKTTGFWDSDDTDSIAYMRLKVNLLW